MTLQELYEQITALQAQGFGDATVVFVDFTGRRHILQLVKKSKHFNVDGEWLYDQVKLILD